MSQQEEPVNKTETGEQTSEVPGEIQGVPAFLKKLIVVKVVLIAVIAAVVYFSLS